MPIHHTYHIFEKKNQQTKNIQTYTLADTLGHSGKSTTIRESNHGSGVCREHNT